MTRPRFATVVRAIQVPAALIVLVAVGGGLASLGPNSLDRYVTISAVNLVFAIGVYVYVGTTGVISFGHFGFATLGAYVGGLMSMGTRLKSATLPNLPHFIADTQLDPLLAIVVGGCAAAFVALLLAPAIGRISGLAASLATLSLLFIARSVAANLTTFTRGTAGLSSVPRWTTLTNTLVVASIFIVGVYAYQRSTSGLRLRSSKSDLVAARALGVNVGVERSIAWVLSAFIVGCGGAMFVMLLGSIGPETLFINQTFLVVAMVVVGGAGSLSGTVVGVLVVSTISEVLTRAEDSGSLLGLVPVPQRPGLRNVVVAVLLIAMLTLRPSGLTGGREVRPLDRGAVLWAHRRRGSGRIGRARLVREGDLRR